MTILFSQFMSGFMAPWWGVRWVLKERRLLKLAIIPFFIGILFFILGAIFATTWLVPAVVGWLPGGLGLGATGILYWISLPLVLIVWLLVGALQILLSYLFIIVLAGPFYGLIAEETFRLLGEPGADKKSFGLAIRLFFYGLFKVAVLLTITIFCLVMSLIPGVALLAAFVLFMMIAFDLTDYSFEVRQLKLSESFAFILRHFWTYLGFAAGVSLSHLVPGLFLLLGPGFVCGAAKMYIQIGKREI